MNTRINVRENKFLYFYVKLIKNKLSKFNFKILVGKLLFLVPRTSEQKTNKIGVRKLLLQHFASDMCIHYISHLFGYALEQTVKRV